MTKHTSTQNTEVLADRTRVGEETIYIRGHSQKEIRRLIDQAAILRPTTERLLRQQTVDWLLTILRGGAPSCDAAGRLIEHLSSAGLPQPALFSETPVGGGVDAPLYAWLAGVARTLLPRTTDTGVVTAETIAIDTIESRLRSAVVDARSQVEWPAQACARTHV
jgi:hypothetical protein